MHCTFSLAAFPVSECIVCLTNSKANEGLRIKLVGLLVENLEKSLGFRLRSRESMEPQRTGSFLKNS